MNDSRNGSIIASVVKRALAICFVLIMLCGNALAAKKATVYSDSMKVYKKASTSGELMGSLKEGTSFYITKYNNTWAKISYKGYTGYVYLSDIQLAKSARAKCYAAKKTVVYERGSASSDKLGTIAAGTTLYIAGRDGDYIMCQNQSGTVTGYIYKGNLSWTKPKVDTSTTPSIPDISDDSRAEMPSALKSTTSSCTSSSSNSTKIEYVIYVAQNQLGKRYSTNPSEPTTFDCATLVYYCFRKAGERIESSAIGQGYDDSYEKITSISDLNRGDVVCFNTNETDNDLCDHTGIYLGSGRFLHASSGAGLVIVSDLTSGYYNRNFSWGRRIFD